MIVMINPPFVNIKSTNYIFFRHNSYPNPALALFAGLFHDKGLPYYCIDCKLEDLNFEESIERLKEDLTGKAVTYFGITISTTTAVYDDFDFIRALAKEFPGVPIVAGGPHVTALPDDSLKSCKEIDVVVRFNGISPVLELYDYYTGREKIKSLSEIHGLVYKDAGSIRKCNTWRFRPFAGTLGGYGKRI